MLRYGLRYGLGYELEYGFGYVLGNRVWVKVRVNKDRGIKSRTPDQAVLYRWRKSIAMRSRNAKCMPLIVSETLLS